jgi:hypothetical protein
MLPEQVLSQLAEKEEMIGVAVSGKKPLGKFTLAVEAATEDEPNFEDQDDVEAFIETVLASPEQPKKSDPMHSLYLRVIRGLVAIAKGRQTKATMDGEKREVTAEMLSEPLYTLVSTIQRGIEMQGTHDYETANELPEGYGDWREVIAPKTKESLKPDCLRALGVSEPAKAERSEKTETAQIRLNRLQTRAALSRLRLTVSHEPWSSWSVPQREAWLAKLESLLGDGVHHQSVIKQRIKTERETIAYQRREEQLDRIENGEIEPLSEPAKAVAATMNGADVTKICDEEAL